MGANVELAATIADHIQGHAGGGLQWLQGGDWNFQVEEFQTTDFLDRLGCLTAVPPQGQVSCVVKGTGRLLDFFLVSPAFCRGSRK